MSRLRNRSDEEVSALADKGDKVALRECRRRNLVELIEGDPVMYPDEVKELRDFLVRLSDVCISAGWSGEPAMDVWLAGKLGVPLLQHLRLGDV